MKPTTEHDIAEIGGIEHIHLPDPGDEISKLARMHRFSERAQDIELVREPVPLQYRAGLTERDVANRCEERRWVLNPYFSVPVALGLVCLFAWDWVRGVVGRFL